MRLSVARRNRPLRITTKPTVSERLARMLLRVLRQYRLEILALALGAVLAWRLSRLGVPAMLGSAVAAGVAAAGLGVEPVARRVIASFREARVCRQWERACRHAQLATPADRVPQAVIVEPVPAGDRLEVFVPKGGSVPQLENASETIAACLQVREVRVTRDPSNARRASALVMRRDPLDVPEPLGWPNRYAERLSMWDPIPVGLDEDGQVVRVSLVERNLLVGGLPGGGKSAAASQIVATAALDPSVVLWLFDGKLVELAAWTPCATRSVGFEMDDAIDALWQLRREMNGRYEILDERKKRKIVRADGLALHVAVLDELALYAASHDRKLKAEFNDLLEDLVRRGRAAGIIVIAATQKPSADVIPTSLRDLFAFRWALRCTTPQASDTVLGQGWASQGYSAGTIDMAQSGVGYLLHEGGEPVRLRAFYLDDDDLAAIAKRAADLRGREHRS